MTLIDRWNQLARDRRKPALIIGCTALLGVAGLMLANPGQTQQQDATPPRINQ
jgi:hypothetical protein